MAKAKHLWQKNQREKFKKRHPEGKKVFARTKRKLGLPRILTTEEQREFYQKNKPQ